MGTFAAAGPMGTFATVGPIGTFAAIGPSLAMTAGDDTDGHLASKRCSNEMARFQEAKR
jgi:hypothetical protein